MTRQIQQRAAHNRIARQKDQDPEEDPPRKQRRPPPIITISRPVVTLPIPTLPVDEETTTTPILPTTTAETTTSVAPVVVPPVRVTSTSSSLPTLPTTTSTTSSSSSPTPQSSSFRTLPPPTVTGTPSRSTASSTPPPVASSGVSTGVLVGGIGGGIIGIAVISFLLVFYIRRVRAKNADEAAFSADNFRRSAVLLDDPPAHGSGNMGGNKPRPPTMIERHVANTPAPASFGHYGDVQQPYNTGAYGAPQQQQYTSFSPGEIFVPGQSTSPPLHSNSANPILPPAAVYASQPPVSHASAALGSAYNDQREYANGSRSYGKPTSSGGAAPQSAYLSRQPSVPAPAAASTSQARYVDMNRVAPDTSITEEPVQPLNIRSTRPKRSASTHTTVYNPEDAYGGI